MPTDQHLDTVGLLKAKVEGEIARLEPSIADRENYDDTRVRLHVKAEALRWVLREIEALPPVGVGEGFPQPQRRDGKPPCGECHLRPGETCDICGATTPLGAEDLERAAKKRLLGYVFEACQPSHGDVFGWIDDHADEMIRAALNLPVEPGQ